MTATLTPDAITDCSYLDAERTWWNYAECAAYLRRKTGVIVKGATLRNYASRGYFRKSPRNMALVERTSFMGWVHAGCPLPKK